MPASVQVRIGLPMLENTEDAICEMKIIVLYSAF